MSSYNKMMPLSAFVIGIVCNANASSNWQNKMFQSNYLTQINEDELENLNIDEFIKLRDNISQNKENHVYKKTSNNGSVAITTSAFLYYRARFLSKNNNVRRKPAMPTNTSSLKISNKSDYNKNMSSNSYVGGFESWDEVKTVLIEFSKETFDAFKSLPHLIISAYRTAENNLYDEDVIPID